jgi:mannose-6-phosphate isomerase
VVFEVQENSDVTFRLYDWDRIDAKTGEPRELQVEKALASIDFGQGVIGPSVPVPEATSPIQRERLFQCVHFWLWRLRGSEPFAVGKDNEVRILVCIEGSGNVEHNDAPYPIGKGDVMLLPAAVGGCVCVPDPSIVMLEISIPDPK